MPVAQDKEFDNLFKATFEDAEIAPSAGLWDNIETKITPKNKNFLMKYWAAAAAVLVMGATTLIVYNNNNVAEQQVSSAKPAKSSPQIIERDAPSVEEQIEERNPQVFVAVAKPNDNYRRQEKPKERLIKNDNVPVEAQNQILAIVSEGELQKSVSDKTTDGSTSIEVEAVSSQEKIVFASVEPTIFVASLDKNDVSADKGIRNAGDLINLVVGVVDKKKNKFIRFKSSDEGSTLAAINIGPFRFGKQTD